MLFAAFVVKIQVRLWLRLRRVVSFVVGSNFPKEKVSRWEKRLMEFAYSI